MEDQDRHPSIWKSCHWHPEGGQGVLGVLMPPLGEALAGMWLCCSICNLMAAAAWEEQDRETEARSSRHGVVPPNPKG